MKHMVQDRTQAARDLSDHSPGRSVRPPTPRADVALSGRRKWQPTPVFLPRESRGQRSLVGCRLRGRTESGMTEATLQQQQQQH